MVVSVGELKQALQTADRDRETLVAEYEITINSLKEEILKLKTNVDAKKSQAPLESSTQSSARVRSRQVNDSAFKTPSRKKAPASAFTKSPCTLTKSRRTPRNRAPTLDE